MRIAIYILSGLLLLGGGGIIKYYMELKDTEQQLEETKKQLESCLEVPDFSPSMFNVQEFSGVRRKRQFKVECRNLRRVDNFFNERCVVSKDLDVTNEEVIRLTEDDYNGRMFKSNYITEWVEDWEFYIDLSNPTKWHTEHGTKTITFTAPEIHVKRLAKGGGHLAYTNDLAVWESDSRNLLKMVLLKEYFSDNRAKVYLKEHYAAIETEMERSIKTFMSNLSEKLGYQDYNVEVNFQAPQNTGG